MTSDFNKINKMKTVLFYGFVLIILTFKVVRPEIILENLSPEIILNNHEIVFPSIQYTNHERMKRYASIDNVERKSNKYREMNIRFNALGKHFDMNLNQNMKLLSPNFQVETLDERGKIIHSHEMKNCFYDGKLVNNNRSMVAISTCSGLRGMIKTPNQNYYIQPFHKVQSNDINKEPHIVRRMSANEFDLDFIDEMEHDRKKRSTGAQDQESSTCGLDDSKPHVRWIRGIQSEKLGEQTIETLLTLDRSMAQFYGVDSAKEFALSIANVAHNVLRDPSIGPNTMNFVISKMVVLTAPLPDLAINHHARNTLDSFGRWADRRNQISDTDENPIYDYSVLLTKHDICVDRNQPCETTGLTFVGGMCDRDRSAAVIEADGFNTAFSLAHQIGHSLGIDHDGIGNTCEGSHKVMESDGGTASDAYHWSHCSVDYLQLFLRKNQSKCLSNVPLKTKRESIELYDNVGSIYSADGQCRFAMGDRALACYQSDQNEICAELMCLHPIYQNCTKMRKPAMDGTICGKDLWCKEGICVKKGLRDDLVIDGAWGIWNPYQECSRSCGGGISHRERNCDNPSPQNGGKYCGGNSREYYICNNQPCENVETGIADFRKSQCRKHKNVFYEDRPLNWTSPDSNSNDFSCRLNCVAEDDTSIKRTFGDVIDGTECRVANIPGRCVQGDCNPVGCDLVLGSLHLKDRCGICKGDGSKCAKTIDLKNSSMGLSRSIVNEKLMQRLVTLENHKDTQFDNVAKRLLELRSLMAQVAQKKCDGDGECLRKFGITKKDSVESPPPRVFYWSMMTTGCSVSCGTGTETLFPECRRTDDGSPVLNEFCERIDKQPNTITRSCQHTPCSPQWTTSQWSSCSRTCGTGKKSRNVYCSLDVDNEEFLLSSNQCREQDKPIQLANCNVQLCPAEWVPRPFGQCSSTCGLGRRRRIIVCQRLDNADGFLKTLSDLHCSASKKPQSEIICNAHNPCPGQKKCGGIHDKTSGRITSPDYPSNYGNDMECVHEINVHKGRTIKLTIADMNITSARNEISGTSKCLGDFLRIIDGKCSNASRSPVIKLCGKKTPGYFVSSTNHICMKFVSDDSTTSRGFSLNYAEQPATEKRDNVNIHPVRDICDLQNDVINSPLGVVTSPNYPSSYPANENCKVDFESSDPNGYMLKFDTFQIGTRSGIMDCRSDFLEVEYGEKKERICGNEPVVPTINIPARKFSLRFQSSEYTMDKKGFVLTFVTKKYAQDNSLNNKSVSSIRNYTHTVEEWHNELPKQNGTDVFEENQIHPVSEMKKSFINTNPQEVNKSEKRELVKLLMKLARVNPAKLQNALKRTGYSRKQHDNNNNNNNRGNMVINDEKKSYIPTLSQRYTSRDYYDNKIVDRNDEKDFQKSDDLSMFGESEPFSEYVPNRARSNIPDIPRGMFQDSQNNYIFGTPAAWIADEGAKHLAIKSIIPSAHRKEGDVKGLNSPSELWRLGSVPLKSLTPGMFLRKPFNKITAWKRKMETLHDNKLASLHPTFKRILTTLKTETQPFSGNTANQQLVSSYGNQWSHFMTPALSPVSYWPHWHGNNVLYRSQVPVTSPWNQQPQTWYPSYYGNTYNQDIAKRQYQSMPFTYMPNFGMWNNHCPPKSSFSCRDAIQHSSCQTSNECYAMSCCETGCLAAQKVCMPIYSNAAYKGVYG